MRPNCIGVWAAVILLLLSCSPIALSADDAKKRLDDANRQALQNLDTPPMPSSMDMGPMNLTAFMKQSASMLGIEVEFRPEQHRLVVLESLQYTKVELTEILLDIAMREGLAYEASTNAAGGKVLVVKVLEHRTKDG